MIQYIPHTALRPADWRTTYILRPDLKGLKQSITDFGFLPVPVLARKADSTIIDGFARWYVAQSLDLEVPVIWVECDEVDAMIMHIRLNRHRSQVIAKNLSRAVRTILKSRKYEYEELRILLGITLDEMEVLADGTLIKVRKVPEHKYSKAWVPVETSGRDAVAIQIERPPTPDR